MPGVRDGSRPVELHEGTLLLAIPRGKKDPDGRHWEEFRITLSEYQGHPYIGLRVFGRNRDGQFRPVSGKGCSVRLGEAEQVADAILRALDLANSPGGGRGEARPETSTATSNRSNRR